NHLFLTARMWRARKYPPSITLSALADYPMIIPGRPHANRMRVEHALSGLGKKIQLAHEVECIPAIVDLVRQGHGFGVLSLNAIKSSPWAAHVSIKEILNPTPMFPPSLVTSTRRPKSPFMRKALALIGSVVGEELGQNLNKLPRLKRARYRGPEELRKRQFELGGLFRGADARRVVAPSL